MGEHRKTLGDYLADAEPVGALWPEQVDIVYRDSPRQAHHERLSPAARTLFHVGCFQGEMINGGMSQFFSNSSGDSVQETLTALRVIGATLCVKLLEQGLAAFPNGIAPVDRQMRCELLFAFEERQPAFFKELDKEFYQRVDALGSVPEEDLTALQRAYMQANAAEPVAA